MQKKNGGYWLHNMHYSYIPVFLASTKEKKINSVHLNDFNLAIIWIITKNFYQVTELMTDFPMHDSKSTSKQVFYPNSFLLFFGFNIVCQLLARHVSKKIETLKNIQMD